jgi:hypothetical protein
MAKNAAGKNGEESKFARIVAILRLATTTKNFDEVHGFATCPGARGRNQFPRTAGAFKLESAGFQQFSPASVGCNHARVPPYAHCSGGMN